MWLRSLFLFGIMAADIKLSSTLYGHASFPLLYAAGAMVVPHGAGRDGVFRALATFMLFSSGLSKVRVGGLRWLLPQRQRLGCCHSW